MKRIALGFLVLLAACSRQRDAGWPTYGGNKQENRYSALTQIDKDNVQSLKPVWVYHAVDTDKRTQRETQCQPIVVGNTLYGTTPRMQLFALDPVTGREKWKFDPHTNRYNQNRGVVYWNGTVLYSVGSTLYEIDAQTGEPVQTFGDSGRVSLYAGLDINHPVDNLFVDATSPGIIYKDVLIMGLTVSEAGDAAPGYVRGFDARTGKLKWIFHTIPQPGEPGYETWPKDAYLWAGGTNAWAGMALDEQRGTVFFGTGSPSSDFYGGDRAGKNLYANCIVALNAETGRLKWYYQTIHHDLWDRDLPCPPNLTTITHDGKKIDVVVQTTKDGLTYVLDRDNGTSIFPVEERPVPTAGLPGEKPWPTQPYPLKPAPFCAQDIADSDIDPAALPDAQSYQHGNKFLPPSTQGTLLVGYSGGAEWGGNAVDTDGVLYQNGNNAIWVLQMISLEERRKEAASLSAGQAVFMENCASCHGFDRKGNGKEIPSLVALKQKPDDIARILKNGQGRMPSFQTLLTDAQRDAVIHFLKGTEVGAARIAPEHRDALSAGRGRRDPAAASRDSAAASRDTKFPYEPRYVAKLWDKFTDTLGYPAIKPPWGTLNAIDLNTGDYRWRIPLGEYPELGKPTGTESYGGPLVTAGGLVFIAGTRDAKLRAFDKTNGHEVWEYPLPEAGFATPITYSVAGTQYIVLGCGGGRGLKPGGDYIAFALPQHSNTGWILMAAFVILALFLRTRPQLKGFSFTVLIFAAVSLAMYYPQYFTTVGDFKLSRLIIPLLQVIMFGMGTELSLKEFRQVVKTPKSILIGVACHYTIMPLVSFTIASLFHFPKEIAAGIILVGCCPSGLASNVMSYLAKANLALSVSVTTVSTLLAPLITPLLMHYLAGSFVEVHFWAMAWDITQIVIIPIAAGLAFHYTLKGQVKWLDRAMPLVSMGGIALIIVVITAAGRDSLMEVGLLLIAATLIQNLAGYALGYGAARLLKLPERDARTISLEVGMQNGGLASGIALKLGKLATVGLGPAIFGPLMNITGSSLATWWHRRPPEA